MMLLKSVWRALTILIIFHQSLCDECNLTYPCTPGDRRGNADNCYNYFECNQFKGLWEDKTCELDRKFDISTKTCTYSVSVECAMPCTTTVETLITTALPIQTTIQSTTVKPTTVKLASDTTHQTTTYKLTTEKLPFINTIESIENPNVIPVEDQPTKSLPVVPLSTQSRILSTLIDRPTTIPSDTDGTFTLRGSPSAVADVTTGPRTASSGLSVTIICIIVAVVVVIIILAGVVIIYIFIKRKNRKRHSLPRQKPAIENPIYRKKTPNSDTQLTHNYRFSRDSNLPMTFEKRKKNNFKILNNNVNNKYVSSDNSHHQKEQPKKNYIPASIKDKRRAPPPPNPFTGVIDEEDDNVPYVAPFIDNKEAQHMGENPYADPRDINGKLNSGEAHPMTTFGNSNTPIQHQSDLFSSSDSDEEDDFDESFDEVEDQSKRISKVNDQPNRTSTGNPGALDSSFSSKSSKKQAPPPPNPFGVSDFDEQSELELNKDDSASIHSNKSHNVSDQQETYRDKDNVDLNQSDPLIQKSNETSNKDSDNRLNNEETADLDESWDSQQSEY